MLESLGAFLRMGTDQAWDAEGKEEKRKSADEKEAGNDDGGGD